MYCPSCGSEERQPSQFCRACGTDLRVVRTSLERPDSITASAVSAREQIGLAVADQIRQLRKAKISNTWRKRSCRLLRSFWSRRKNGVCAGCARE